MEKQIINWFANGETGISSKVMASTVAGVKSKSVGHPGDPSDFNRCLLFLNDVPEARKHLDKLREVSDHWDILIDHFEEVEKTFIDEVGFNWCKAKSAPKTYKLMKSIYKPYEPNYHTR